MFISILATILEIVGPFAGTYTGAYYYYSCLDCENSTAGDYTLQILSIIVFIIIIIIALNDLLPNRFISKDLTKFGFLLSIITIIFAIAGLTSFGIYYSALEWWPEMGFYAIIIGGILNTIFFFLKQKNV